MTHRQLVDKYRELTGVHNDDIHMWYNNGSNSVLLRLANKQEIIFTYHGRTKWRVETIAMFKDDMKK
jgi:hypothetical protein